MSNGKNMIIVLIVGLIKKTLFKNESNFGGNVNVKLICLFMQQKLI